VAPRNGYISNSFLANSRKQGATAIVGARPQVVWPNSVLASTAVGLAVDLIANWTRKQRSHAYLVYDGKEGTVKDSVTLRNLTRPCSYYAASDVDDPVLLEL
jgi:hypothetical protein